MQLQSPEEILQCSVRPFFFPGTLLLPGVDTVLLCPIDMHGGQAQRIVNALMTGIDKALPEGHFLLGYLLFCI